MLRALAGGTSGGLRARTMKARLMALITPGFWQGDAGVTGTWQNNSGLTGFWS